MSCRYPICMFLINAIKTLQKKKKNAHVALFQEYNVSHPDSLGSDQ